MVKSVALLILAMISIQTGASLAKSLFPLAGAAGTTTLRLFFATAILWGIWRPWRSKLQIIDMKNLLIYGSALGFMNLTFYFALLRIPLGLAVTLEFLGPLTLSIYLSRKKIDFFWAFLAAAGIFLVMPKTDLSSGLDPIGVGFALLAGIFWALYILFGQKASKNIHEGVATSVGMAFAALVVIPFGLVLDGSRLLNLSILPMGVLVAVLSSALPYSLEMYSLKKMPTRTFGILMSLEPAVASLVGLLFLHESLSGLQWMAILCVISASLGSSLTSEKLVTPDT